MYMKQRTKPKTTPAILPVLETHFHPDILFYSEMLVSLETYAKVKFLYN